MIGASTTDTLYNIHSALSSHQKLLELAVINNESICIDDMTIGLYYLFECISEAMRFEINNRV